MKKAVIIPSAQCMLEDTDFNKALFMVEKASLKGNLMLQHSLYNNKNFIINR